MIEEVSNCYFVNQVPLLCQMLCKLAKDNSNYYLETDAFTTFAWKVSF